MHTSSRELIEVYHHELSGAGSKKRLMMARKNSYAASPTRVDKVKLSNDFQQNRARDTNSPLKLKQRGSKLNVKNEEKIRQLKNVGSSELMQVIANMQLSAVESKERSGSPKKKTLNFPPGSLIKAAAGMAKTNTFDTLLKGQSLPIKDSPF